MINSTSSAVYGGGKGQPTVVNGNIFINTSTSSDNILMHTNFTTHIIISYNFNTVNIIFEK